MSIYGKSPVSYADWRKIYQSHLYGLGVSYHTYWRAKSAGLDFLICDCWRRVYTKIRRIERIEVHLQEAHERNDKTLRDINREFGIDQ